MDCWCEPRQESTQRGFNGAAALLCDVCFVMFCNVCFAMDVMLAILKYIFTGISAPAISIWTIGKYLGISGCCGCKPGYCCFLRYPAPISQSFRYPLGVLHGFLSQVIGATIEAACDTRLEEHSSIFQLAAEAMNSMTMSEMVESPLDMQT